MHYLNTGQLLCYDTRGREIPCRGSGQDAEGRPGVPWPDPRFEATPDTALDRLTGLEWTRRANFTGHPVTWTEAFDRVRSLNAAGFAGHEDWRVPNRRELRSLISHQTRDPALPGGHPFTEVFLGFTWTSTTAAINPAFAWYVHPEGGRMFYGRKDEHRLVWPVRGRSPVLPVTGQTRCYDAAGQPVVCAGTGQDGELRSGVPWPVPRFRSTAETVRDRLTGLVWTRNADLAGEWTRWDEAFEVVRRLNEDRIGGLDRWALPTVNELESLVDASTHSPALPGGHPFEAVQEAYWSSTTSAYEPDWCMALYMRKGAVGVGQKKDPNFSVWAVARGAPGRRRAQPDITQVPAPVGP